MKTASNRQLTLLRKLKRKKYRYKERLFFVEGIRAVRQVAANNVIEIDTLFFDEHQGYAAESYWEKLIAENQAALVGNKDFSRIADTTNPQGVLALCRMPEEQKVDEMVKKSGVIVALDEIQDPGNVGTIIRTASWFGVRGLLSGKGSADLFHPKVVRSTAGATGTVRHRNGELPDLLNKFESDGWRAVLLNKGERSVPLSDVESYSKTILVVGNEGHGIQPALFNEHRLQVEISSPENGNETVESLNAAIATSIGLYQLMA